MKLGPIVITTMAQMKKMLKLTEEMENSMQDTLRSLEKAQEEFLALEKEYGELRAKMKSLEMEKALRGTQRSLEKADQEIEALEMENAELRSKIKALGSGKGR